MPVIFKEFRSTIYMGVAWRILACPRGAQKGLGSGRVVALGGEGHLCPPLPPPCLNLHEIANSSLGEEKANHEPCKPLTSGPLSKGHF